jgi:hypothetical protein
MHRSSADRLTKSQQKSRTVMLQPSAQGSDLTVCCVDILSAKATACCAPKVAMDLRRYPDAMRFSSSGYFFFSWLPSSPSSLSWPCCPMHRSDYTAIAKLILRASKKVDDRLSIAICDRMRPSHDAWTQRALPDQDERSSHVVGRKADDHEAEPSVGSSAAWPIRRRLGNGEASFRPAQAPSKRAPATRTDAQCRAQRSLRYRSD